MSQVASAVEPVAPHRDIADRHREIRGHSERALGMVYESEYWWIESAIAGAAAGTVRSMRHPHFCRDKVTDRFNGASFIRWWGK